MAVRSWTGLGADALWSNVLNWDGGASVPATTDTVTFTSTGAAFPCTIDALGTWSGGPVNINSGYTNTITQNTGVNFTSGAYAQAGGTFTCHSAATFTSTSFALTGGAFNQGGAFVSTTFAANTSSPSYNGSSASMSTTAVTFGNSATIVATSGTWTLAGSWTQSGASTTFTGNGGTIAVTATCTFNDARSTFNLVTITINTIFGGLTVSAGTTIPLGDAPSVRCGTNASVGTLTVTGTVTASGVITCRGSLSISAGTGTLSGSITDINFVNTGAVTVGMTLTVATTATIPSGMNLKYTSDTVVAHQFSGGGKTFGTVWVNPGISGAQFTLTTSCTIGTLLVNDAAYYTNLSFTAGLTYTVTTFTVVGASGKMVSIRSATAGSPFTLTAAGSQTASYVAISDSTVNASPTWTADSNSSNVGGNTNWLGFSSGSSSGAIGQSGKRVRQGGA